jgi:hypothetical protein
MVILEQSNLYFYGYLGAKPPLFLGQTTTIFMVALEQNNLYFYGYLGATEPLFLWLCVPTLRAAQPMIFLIQ